MTVYHAGLLVGRVGLFVELVLLLGELVSIVTTLAVMKLT